MPEDLKILKAEFNTGTLVITSMGKLQGSFACRTGVWKRAGRDLEEILGSW